jgi:hypothetical protein
MITHGTETITPEVAQLRLELIEKAAAAGIVPKRRLDPSRVTRYAAAMREGRWVHNGQTLGLDPEGIPLNGMHRYKAATVAKVPFVSSVAYGVPRSTLPTQDTGKSRTASDILGMEGHTYYSRQAAAASWVHRIRSEYMGVKGILDPEVAVIWVRSNPEMLRSAKVVEKIAYLMGGGLAAALHFLFSEQDETAADLFFELLRTGANLGENNPILVLKNKLTRAESSSKKKDGMSREEKGVAIIRAWNAWKAGETRKVLSGYKRDRDGRPMWPEIE